MLVNFRPRALVEPKVVQARLSERRFILLESSIEPRVAAPELPHEQWIEDACRLNQLAQGLLISGGERRQSTFSGVDTKRADICFSSLRSGGGAAVACWHAPSINTNTGGRILRMPRRIAD